MLSYSMRAKYYIGITGVIIVVMRRINENNKILKYVFVYNPVPAVRVKLFINFLYTKS